jgi:hypothetical protein
MSYSEKDGQVILTMSREDYDWLLMALGMATGLAARDSCDVTPWLDVVNRLNSGNPNYTPYQVEAEKK